MGDVLVEYGDFMISVILIAVVVWGLSFVLKGLYSEETSWSRVYNYKYKTTQIAEDGTESPGLDLGWDNHAVGDVPNNEDDTHMYE